MKLLKSLTISFVLAILTLSSLSAQSSLNTVNVDISVLKDYEGEALTVDSTVGGVGFTSSKINPTCTGQCIPALNRAQLATCVNYSANSINILANGTAPTTTVGLLITGGQAFTVRGYANIAQFKAIRTGGSSGTLYCVFSRINGAV